MDIDYSIRPILAIAVSLVAAAAIWGFRRQANLRDAVSLVAAVAKFLIVIGSPHILR